MAFITPAIAAYAAAAATVAGTAVSAIGASQSAAAQSKAANYNAQIQAQNSQIAQQNATQAAQAGEVQAEAAQQKTRAAVGGMLASEAASGIDVNSGSPLDVRSSSAMLGQQSALNIENNTGRTVWGYQTQASGFQDQSQLDTMESQNDQIAGGVKADATILGGLGQATDQWAKYMNTNSFATPGATSTSGWDDNTQW